MKEIKELTKEQEAKLEVYRDEYIKIGLNTDRIDKVKAEETINLLYTELLQKKQVPVLFFDNPVDAWNATCLFTKYADYKHEEILSKLNNTKELEELKGISFVYPYLNGSFESYIFAFYDYFINELTVEVEEKLLKNYLIWRRTMDLGLIYTLDNVCIVCEKPTKISKNEKGLHCEDGPALTYKGKVELWYLNGVEVGKEIVMTPAEEITSDMILKEKNAEVRAQIIKKVGITNVIEKCGAKSVEKNEVYELLNFDIIDGTFRPYLKMLNPSTGEYHVEGVHPDCTTIEKALAWRDVEDTYIKPKILT